MKKNKMYYAVINNEDGTSLFGSEKAIINYANMICDVFDEWHKVNDTFVDKIHTINEAIGYLTQKDIIIKELPDLEKKLKNNYVIYIEEE